VLSWSEIGFFYFAGTWLVLLFNNGHDSILQMLALLNIISLPYTFYSIYYQWRIAKQWCVFCCTVQAILWLDFFAFLPSLLHGLQTPTLLEWSSMVMGMTIPLLSWMLIKPYLLQAKQIAPLKAQLRRFKYNRDLFNKMLNDEVKYALPDARHSLMIGNPEAGHVITMVTNPYCQPCSRAHKLLDEWLPSRDDVKLQVVFSTVENEEDKKTTVAAHLMSLQAGQSNAALKHALDDWYEQKQKNYEAWAKEHPVKSQTAHTEVLKTQREWCKLTEVTGTPTIFINGRRLPHNYQTEDIKYFI
jgi:protein-disulfide isomerase